MSVKQQQITTERVIEYLRTAIFDGECGLSDVPNLIKRVIEEDLWRERILPNTQAKIVFGSFAEFVTSSPPEGLGTQLKTVQKLCAEDLETLELLEQVKTKHFHGGDRRSENFKRDNVPLEKPSRGNSLSYALKKLRANRVDLHQSVLAGKISVHQAMIAAGFRKPKFQLTKDMEKVIEFIRKHFDQSEIDQLIDRLKP